MILIVVQAIQTDINTVGCQLGLTCQANTCDTTFDEDTGSTVCAGDVNSCGSILEEDLCNGIGCTWNADKDRCVREEDDSPACDRLSPAQCERLGAG